MYQQVPPGAGNTHCPLVYLPLDGGGLGGGELLRTERISPDIRQPQEP